MNIVQVIGPGMVDSLAVLAKEIWWEHYTPIIGLAQVEYMLSAYQSSAAITRQINEDGYLYYLLQESDGENVGYFGVVVKERERELFLSKLYVKKNCRGRGYARQALLFIEDLTRNAGAALISLTVNKNNTASIDAYYHMGFKNKGSVVMDIGNGFVMDDLRLEKFV